MNARADEEPPSGSSYASVSVEADDADARLFSGALGFSVGKRGQLDVAAGRSSVDLGSTRTNTTFASLDGSLDAGRLQLQIGYAYRKDGDSFDQHDLRGAVTWLLGRGQVGVDAFYRTADDETTTSIERRRRDPLAVRTTESIDGTGVGLHGAVDVSNRVRLFAAAMSYDYDRDVDAPAFLARLPRLGVRVSGVTRDEAFLDNTVRAGIDYSLDTVTLTALYVRDDQLDTDIITDTLELSARFLIGEHWLISPWIGHFSDEIAGGSAFAGLTVGVMW